MGIFTNFYWIIIVPVGVIVERLLFKVNFYRFDKNNPLDVNLNDTQPHPKKDCTYTNLSLQLLR